jgi:methyl-accepting chemotaxis protein
MTAKKTQKDLENADSLNTDVRTKEQATEFLIAKEYLNPGKPTDLQTLSHILFQLRHPMIRMPKVLTDRIRAVTILLADASAQQMADMITETIKSQLQECMTAFMAEVETMRDTVKHVTVAAIDIKGKMEDFNEGFQETADQLAQAAHELTEKTAKNTNTMIGSWHRISSELTHTHS